MEIGARLKEARVAKDISLDSLQETTKIQKRYLVAIEEGNFKILPGKFYARAFIKEYAVAVGLDPSELLEEYKDEIPQTEQDSTDQYTRIQRSRKENNPTKNSAIFSIIPTIIVVILVIGIIFAAWFFIQQSSDGSTEPVDDQSDDNEIIYNPDESEQGSQGEDDTTANENDTTDESQTDDSIEDGDAETNAPDPELTVVEQGTGSSPRSTLTLENPSDEVKLVLESDGNTWLDVENSDGKSFFSSSFTSDKSPLEFDVSGEEQIYLNIGNASDLTITINGVEVEYPLNPEEEVRQHLWINIGKTEDQAN